MAQLSSRERERLKALLEDKMFDDHLTGIASIMKMFDDHSTEIANIRKDLHSINQEIKNILGLDE